MCGRFARHTSTDTIAAMLGVEAVHDPGVSWNITPSSLPLVATSKRLGQGLWGITKGDRSMINARAEKLATSPFWRSAFQKRRLLVPADGWYEWMQTESGKQPFYITHWRREPLMLAGIFEGGADDGLAPRFVIITEPAAPEIQHIHDRMPVVLDRGSWKAWMDPEIQDRDAIRAATHRLDPQQLEAHPVSTLVNSPKNNGPELVEPLKG